MSSNDIHGIQDGWKVKTADGAQIGTVAETTERSIAVTAGVLASGRHHLPAGVLEHVRPDLGEIGVSLTKEEFEAGDWSEPPREGPRVTGAPLNPEIAHEADPITPRSLENPDNPIAS